MPPDPPPLTVLSCGCVLGSRYDDDGVPVLTLSACSVDCVHVRLTLEEADAQGVPATVRRDDGGP